MLVAGEVARPAQRMCFSEKLELFSHDFEGTEVFIHFLIVSKLSEQNWYKQGLEHDEQKFITKQNVTMKNIKNLRLFNIHLR